MPRVKEVVKAALLLKELTAWGRVTHWSSNKQVQQVQRIISECQSAVEEANKMR